MAVCDVQILGGAISNEAVYVYDSRQSGHPRPPAGLLAKAAKALESVVTIEKVDGRSAAATKLMAAMGLGVKCGDTVTIKIEGGSEDDRFSEMELFFKQNL